MPAQEAPVSLVFSSHGPLVQSDRIPIVGETHALISLIRHVAGNRRESVGISRCGLAHLRLSFHASSNDTRSRHAQGRSRHCARTEWLGLSAAIRRALCCTYAQAS